MNTRILVPFSRPHLIPDLFGFWNTNDHKIYHPICHDPLHAFTVTPLIQPLYCGTLPEGWNAMYWKLNYFLDQMPIHDEDRYGFMCDDDAYEPGFYEKLSKHDDDVIIVSMKRGKRQPPGGNGHPPTTLLAQRENMKIGSVGMEQLFIRGKLLKNYRFKNFPEADGEMICRVVAENKVKYLPRAFIHFNFFEPGRWN